MLAADQDCKLNYLGQIKKVKGIINIISSALFQQHYLIHGFILIKMLLRYRFKKKSYVKM